MPTRRREGRGREPIGKPPAREGGNRHETPIDWAHLSRFTMNDTALEAEVLGLFAMEAPRYLARLETADDRDAWIEAAHTLKGSARAVGAWAIAECAQAAEALQLGAPHEFVGGRGRAGGSGTRSSARQVLERLSKAVHQTLVYIEQMRPQPAVPETMAHGA